jgi:hypothetical protein
MVFHEVAHAAVGIRSGQFQVAKVLMLDEDTLSTQFGAPSPIKNPADDSYLASILAGVLCGRPLGLDASRDEEILKQFPVEQVIAAVPAASDAIRFCLANLSEDILARMWGTLIEEGGLLLGRDLGDAEPVGARIH